MSKTIVLEGIFEDPRSLREFLDALKVSELGKRHHHRAQMQIVYKKTAIHITLYFVDIVDFLIRYSLKDGVLRGWEGNFTIGLPA